MKEEKEEKRREVLVTKYSRENKFERSEKEEAGSSCEESEEIEIEIELENERKKLFFPPKKKSRKEKVDSKGREEEEREGVRSETKLCSEANLEEIENEVKKKLREEEWFVSFAKEDGNCLFRAVGEQVYGDAEFHSVVRRQCVEYMEKESSHFGSFVGGEEWEAYLERKSKEGCFGDHLEIQAISELYARPVHIYQNGRLLNIFLPSPTNSPPIRLEYVNGNHYNAIIDPNSPSVGEGIGLSNYKLPEKSTNQIQLEKGIQQSESVQLEEEIVEHTIQQSSLEKPFQNIEEEVVKQVIHQSYKEDHFFQDFSQDIEMEDQS